MANIGLIVEYNPFHNGHLYHLEEARKSFPGSRIICVMSGSWVQRGEPAIFNKWARARMALMGGADVVLELPTIYALQSADRFAFGAVRTLEGCGLISHLCFGSELGDAGPLEKAASLFSREPPEFKTLLKEYLDRGDSYPRALSRAAAGYWGREDMKEILHSPNNILGIEYMKHLKKASSSIIPFTIQRKGASYHSRDLKGTIASATAIRQGFKEQDPGIYQALPPWSSRIIAGETAAGRGPLFWDLLCPALMAALRKASLRDLSALPDMEEGLPRRFYKACRRHGTLREFLREAATKRYTQSRLQRILCYLFLGIEGRELEAFNQAGPRYLRLLGFSSRGQGFLHNLKKRESLPLVTRPARYLRHSTDTLGKRMLALDIKGCDLHTLLYPSPGARRGGQDYITTPVQTRE